MYVRRTLGVIANLVNRAPRYQPIHPADAGQYPGRPDGREDPLPHYCQLQIAGWPSHVVEVDMALLGHIDARISLAKIKLSIGGKVANACTNQANPSHQQPGPDQADYEHSRNREDVQR